MNLETVQQGGIKAIMKRKNFADFMFQPSPKHFDGAKVWRIGMKKQQISVFVFQTA